MSSVFAPAKATSSIVALTTFWDNVVVIPAYVGTILPFRFSLSGVITPWFAAYPSRYTNGDPVTIDTAVPFPILTENEVRLLFSVITKLPLNLTASLVNPTNLTWWSTFNPWLLVVVTIPTPVVLL